MFFTIYILNVVILHDILVNLFNILARHTDGFAYIFSVLTILFVLQVTEINKVFCSLLILGFDRLQILGNIIKLKDANSNLLLLYHMVI